MLHNLKLFPRQFPILPTVYYCMCLRRQLFVKDLGVTSYQQTTFQQRDGKCIQEIPTTIEDRLDFIFLITVIINGSIIAGQQSDTKRSFLFEGTSM